MIILEKLKAWWNKAYINRFLSHAVGMSGVELCFCLLVCFALGLGLGVGIFFPWSSGLNYYDNVSLVHSSLVQEQEQATPKIKYYIYDDGCCGSDFDFELDSLP